MRASGTGFAERKDGIKNPIFQSVWASLIRSRQDLGPHGFATSQKLGGFVRRLWIKGDRHLFVAKEQRAGTVFPFPNIHPPRIPSLPSAGNPSTPQFVQIPPHLFRLRCEIRLPASPSCKSGSSGQHSPPRPRLSSLCNAPVTSTDPSANPA